MKAVCPGCDALVEITSTGERIAQGWSAMRWRIVMHAARKDGPHRETVRLGSGRIV